MVTALPRCADHLQNLDARGILIFKRWLPNEEPVVVIISSINKSVVSRGCRRARFWVISASRNGRRDWVNKGDREWGV